MDANLTPEQHATPEDPLAVALAELAVLQAKNADLADQFLRAKAEAENARRRAEKKSPKHASSRWKPLPKACCPWPTA